MRRVLVPSLLLAAVAAYSLPTYADDDRLCTLQFRVRLSGYWNSFGGGQGVLICPADTPVTHEKSPMRLLITAKDPREQFSMEEFNGEIRELPISQLRENTGVAFSVKLAEGEIGINHPESYLLRLSAGDSFPTTQNPPHLRIFDPLEAEGDQRLSLAAVRGALKDSIWILVLAPQTAPPGTLR